LVIVFNSLESVEMKYPFNIIRFIVLFLVIIFLFNLSCSKEIKQPEGFCSECTPFTGNYVMKSFYSIDTEWMSIPCQLPPSFFGQSNSNLLSGYLKLDNFKSGNRSIEYYGLVADLEQSTWLIVYDWGNASYNEIFTYGVFNDSILQIDNSDNYFKYYSSFVNNIISIDSIDFYRIGEDSLFNFKNYILRFIPD